MAEKCDFRLFTFHFWKIHFRKVDFGPWGVNLLDPLPPSIKISVYYIIMLGLSIIESIYVLYMLNLYKTTTNYAHPFSHFSWDYFKHPTTNLETPINPVCTFGNQASWVLAFYLIFREIPYASTKMRVINNSIVLLATFVLSLMNFNVTVYFIPLFVIEFLFPFI